MESPTETPRAVDAQLVEQELTREVAEILAALDGVATVKDAASRAVAVEYAVRIAEKEKKLKADRKKVVDPARKLYEYFRDMFDSKLDALDAGKRLLSSRVGAYDIEMERLERIERERREKERREAEEKHKREMAAYQLECDHLAALQDDLEWTRQRTIRLQNEERDRSIAREQAARIEQAETAQDLGMADRVDTILDRATPIASQGPTSMPSATTAALPPKPLPPPPPPPPAAMTSIVAKRADPNSVSRDEWKYDVTDMKALARAVAEDRAPVEYLTLNRGEVGKDVRKLKDEFRCDGIKTWKERNLSFRASKPGEDA